ncbi:MAG: hypothetical protein U0930_15840 [Pirellulales bacterium]
MPIRFAIERVERNKALGRAYAVGLVLGTGTLLLLSSGCRSPWGTQSNQPSFDRLMEIENSSAAMPPSFQSQVGSRRPGNAQQQASNSLNSVPEQLPQNQWAETPIARFAQKPNGGASRRISDMDEYADGALAGLPNEKLSNESLSNEKQELIKNMQRALQGVNADDTDAEKLALNPKQRDGSSRKKSAPAGHNDRYSVHIGDDDEESGLKPADDRIALRPVPPKNKDPKAAKNSPGNENSDEEGIAHASHSGRGKEDSVRKAVAETVLDSEPADAYPRDFDSETKPKKDLTWQQHIQQAIKQLESVDKESLETPQSKIRQQVLARMLALTLNDRHEMLKPVDGLQQGEQDYFNYQFSALADAIDPDANPSVSRKWSTVMINQQKAHSNLASISNLEIHNLTFCVNVTDFGVLEPFRTNTFKSNDEVLLYLELDNFVSVKSSDGKGFETDLQGSYEIVDASGRRIVSQSLPRDTHVCKNMRRDYFIAYRIYMPDKIGPGSYTLKVVIEDMKGRKFGQKEIQFQIQ